MPSFFSTVANHIKSFEKIVVALLLAAMIAFSMVQIVLRLFFHGGPLWIDPLLRHLVVWGGLLGALLAVAEKKHISLDLLGNASLPHSVKNIAYLLIQYLAMAVSTILTYASWIFIVSEYRFGGSALLSVPSWCWNSIFLIAFSGMTLRYLISALLATAGLFHLFPNNEEEGTNGKP